MLNNIKPKIIVLDGYDGSGKTTLAQMLAKHLNGIYVKPFCDSLGNMIGWLYETEQFELNDIVSRKAIEYSLSLCDKSKFLIFDRHWMTSFTQLPRKYYPNWGELPKTFLCWANPDVIQKRLTDRNEKNDKDLNYHRYFCDLFKNIALEFNVKIIDTSDSSPENNLSIILSELEKINHEF